MRDAAAIKAKAGELKQAALRVARSAISGVVASGVDVVTLLALVHVTQMAAGLAAGVGCLAGGVANFALARQWVFGARGNAARQLVLYGLLVVGGGALASGAVVQVATVTLGLSVLAAKLAAAILVFFGWNYPISSRLVFRKEPAR
jgi:putative flippase GtrA